MLNLEARTDLPKEQVISRIKGFFEAQGLSLVDENNDCLSFHGGGGYVTATVFAEKDKTRIDLVTQEWEFQVREFAAGLR